MGIYAGFDEGIRDMRPGGKRRIIVPPELGPPVSFLNCLPLYLHNSAPLHPTPPDPPLFP